MEKDFIYYYTWVGLFLFSWGAISSVMDDGEHIVSVLIVLSLIILPCGRVFGWW